MRLTLIFSFFLSLNFLLILFPRLMPNVISVESTIFWMFWVNGLFILSLILPARASYLFHTSNKANLFSRAMIGQLSRK